LVIGHFLFDCPAMCFPDGVGDGAADSSVMRTAKSINDVRKIERGLVHHVCGSAAATALVDK